MRALAAGARAYLLKSATDEDLIPAVRAVAAGKPCFSPAVTAVLVEDYVRRLQQRGLTDSYHLLTDREGGAPVARGGALEQRSRGTAQSRIIDRGDASSEPDAEAEPPQHRRDRAVCGAKGLDRVNRRGPRERGAILVHEIWLLPPEHEGRGSGSAVYSITSYDRERLRLCWCPESDVRHQSPGGASRLAALLLPHLFPICSVVAPCDPGAAPGIVVPTSDPGHSGWLVPPHQQYSRVLNVLIAQLRGSELVSGSRPEPLPVALGHFETENI
jgi:hypothetical protein